VRVYAEVGNTLQGNFDRIYNVGLGFIGKRSIFNLGIMASDNFFFPVLSFSRRIKTGVG
jgi:hypothetical protein